jgi:DNA-binding CsgD family transcriptional regulator
MRRPTDAGPLDAATTVLRAGLVLVAAVAAVDTGLALAAGESVLTLLEGVVLFSVALLGAVRVDVTERVLRRPGRAATAVLVFAAFGVLDPGLQTNYSQVASAMIWVVAVVSAPAWIAVSLLLAGIGYVAALARHGHSWSWLVHGDGLATFSTQEADLVGNAAAGLLAVLLLRRFLHAAPTILQDVWAGRPAMALTPQLAAAAGGGVPAALPRADPAALTAGLSDAERGVVRLLVVGMAPKQAAAELGVALSTVRSHIASAKRKTGSRTLHQLVAIVAEGERHD